MTRLRLATNRNRRHGFTLIELLVVISIIAVLLSLIAPAVQNARRAARKMQCQSNMHNVAVAVQGFASTNNGTLPPLVSNMTLQSGTVIPINWVIPLLPLLDQSALYREIKQNGTGAVTVQNHNIKVLTCPDDINNVDKALGLSYAANAGYISDALWGKDALNLTVSPPTGYQHYLYTVNYSSAVGYDDGTGSAVYDPADARVAVASGVFWRKLYVHTTGTAPSIQYDYSASDPRATLDSIAVGDGVSNTVMFAENFNSTNWSSPRIDTCAFGIAVSAATPFATNGALWDTPTLPANFGQVTVGTTTYQSTQINTAGTSAVGIPMPSSNHTGSVNFVLCDGSVRSISDNVDNTVYMRLVTPDGKNYLQPLLSDNSF